MSNAALEKPTLESLAVEVRRLQERLEDMEDLMELHAAVECNVGKPGTPWEQVKAELDRDVSRWQSLRLRKTVFPFFMNSKSLIF